MPSKYSSGLYGLITATSTLNLEWPTFFWYLYPASSSARHSSSIIPWYLEPWLSETILCSLPFCANSKKFFKDSTPFDLVRLRSIISAVIVENTTISLRALETATLRRFQPPSLLSGPKFRDNLPSSSGPKAIEKRITSLSSPCTFSRFFTKRFSPSPFAHLSKSTFFENSSCKRSSISVCWLILKVTTPIDWFFNWVSLYRRFISLTIAAPSPSFTRPFLRLKNPSTLTRLTRFSLSLTEGKVSIEFS